MPIQNRIDTAYTDVEYSENKPTVPEEEIIRRAVVRLNGHILGFVIGLIGALGIFAATNFLVFKGGEVVGPHLGLLDQLLLLAVWLVRLTPSESDICVVSLLLGCITRLYQCDP